MAHTARHCLVDNSLQCGVAPKQGCKDDMKGLFWRRSKCLHHNEQVQRSTKNGKFMNSVGNVRRQCSICCCYLGLLLLPVYGALQDRFWLHLIRYYVL